MENFPNSITNSSSQRIIEKQTPSTIDNKSFRSASNAGDIYNRRFLTEFGEYMLTSDLTNWSSLCSDDMNADNGKRKKSKSRSATAPLNFDYQQNLDEWLENCLKDATPAQLSSSSEFLDYNPSSFNTSKSPNPSQIFRKSLSIPKIQQSDQKFQNIHGLPFLLNRPVSYAPHMPRNLKTMQSHTPVEFTSLPPVNFDTGVDTQSIVGNLDLNDPNRRFSDPCLVAPSDAGDSIKPSGKNTPDQQNITESQIGDNKFYTKLWEQINILHETNSKICRNLHENKVEIEALKHTPLRHRRDSLSGLSTHSQPLGYVFGTQSPAPTYHSGMYTPGIMTEVIREVKEAARIREEALLSRVKAMVEERSWSIGEGNLRMMRDVEEMKSQIQHLRSDRKESNKRILQLETENKYIRQLLASVFSNRSADIIHENEIFRSTPIRKNYNPNQDSVPPPIPRQKRNNFNLKYGVVVNHEDGPSTMALNDRNYLQKSMSSDSIKLDKLHTQPHQNDRCSRNSTLTIHSSSGEEGGGNQTQNGSFRMDNNIYTTPENEHTNDGENLLLMEKDIFGLRRDLQDALASKKTAEKRIIALENMVKRLQVKMSHTNDNTTVIYNGNSEKSSALNLTDNTSQPNASSSSNLTQIGVSPKLSLAGPVTDL